MAAADYRMMTDATGQDLVAALQNIAPLQVAPLVVSIPTGQWSGSGSDYYITVNASNVSENSILVPCYGADSRSRLKGPVWCIPAAGSFTIHTSAIPSNTVTILVQFPGVMGEAQYQVLADVYSKSQTYSKSEAVAKTDIVNNLTSTATDKPGSANMLKTLNDKLTSCLVGETLNVSGTTDAGGRITVSKTKRFSYAAVISNVSHDLSTPYSVTIEVIAATTVILRIRSLVDNSAITNTSVDFTVLLFGVES